MYAWDYAHWDSELPESVKMVAATPGLSEARLKLVLGRNAIRWFNLKQSDLPGESVYFGRARRRRPSLAGPEVPEAGCDDVLVGDWRRQEPERACEAVHGRDRLVADCRIVEWKVPLHDRGNDRRGRRWESSPPDLGGPRGVFPENALRPHDGAHGGRHAPRLPGDQRVGRRAPRQRVLPRPGRAIAPPDVDDDPPDT